MAALLQKLSSIYCGTSTNRTAVNLRPPHNKYIDLFYPVLFAFSGDSSLITKDFTFTLISFAFIFETMGNNKRESLLAEN